MTREEAITILQEEISGNLELSLREWKERDEQKLFPALRMAIEALSADVVSREKYDTVCAEYNLLVHNAICRNMCDENCKYEKGKTCYHAREHCLIDSVTSASNCATESPNDVIEKQNDAIEIVRCKDCIHWYEWENGCGSCRRSDNGYNWFGSDARDYCSFGERRGGDSE